MLNFVKLKTRLFKRHALSYRTNIRVRNTETLAILTPRWVYRTQKAVLTNHVWAQRTVLWSRNTLCVSDSLWVVEQYVSGTLYYTTCSYRNQTISELRYKFGSVYTHRSLHHVTALISKSDHRAKYIHRSTIFALVCQHVQNYECSRSANPSTEI